MLFTIQLEGMVSDAHWQSIATWLAAASFDVRLAPKGDPSTTADPPLIVQVHPAKARRLVVTLIAWIQANGDAAPVHLSAPGKRGIVLDADVALSLWKRV